MTGECYAWQLEEPLEAVVFDCDSTLSQIEGITVLAQHSGAAEAVHALTECAMNTAGLDENLYAERLDLVRPTLSQVMAIADDYYSALTPDVEAVLAAFIALGKRVYVISAGLLQAVQPFSVRLGIPPEQVFAVRAFFDEQGAYVDFDRTSPMVHANGKRDVIEQLQSEVVRIAHVGDGMNDVAAAGVVERFVGYGGVCVRPAVASLCDFYIKSLSMAPLLPLLLTREEVPLLGLSATHVYQKGLSLIETAQVQVNL